MTSRSGNHSMPRFGHPGSGLRTVLVYLAGAFLWMAGGCASYVNIPADPKDTAFNAVNMPPVPLVMATALEYAVEQYPVSRPAQIALPAPASDRTFGVALKYLPENVSRWLGRPDDDHNAYRVLSVRIRGSEAIVEILLPTDTPVLDGQYILETTSFGSPTGWHVKKAERFYVTDRRLREAAPPMTVEYLTPPSNPTSPEDSANDDVRTQPLRPIKPADRPSQPADESSSVREITNSPASPELNSEDQGQPAPEEHGLMPVRPARDDNDR